MKVLESECGRRSVKTNRVIFISEANYRSEDFDHDSFNLVIWKQRPNPTEKDLERTLAILRDFKKGQKIIYEVGARESIRTLEPSHALHRNHYRIFSLTG